MRRSWVPCGILFACVLHACQAPVVHSVDGARRQADAGLFLEALKILDGLPPSHPQYTQARTLAQALERRVRSSHEKVLEGLAFRAEWRDEEAIESFHAALEIWPDVVAARELLAATKQRRRLLGSTPEARAARSDSEAVAELSTTPIEEVTTTEIGSEAAEAGAVSKLDPSGSESSRAGSAASKAASTAAKETGEPIASAPVGETRPRSTRAVPSNGSGSTPRVKGKGTTTPTQVSALRRRNLLSQASRHLGRGDMDRALQILEDLWDETTGDPAVRKQLVRVLNQRALLAYGQGRLQAAVDDWQKVLRLDPEHAQTKAFVRAANTELAARKRQ